jgi:[ribosomal protein S5]-alanine N-acetyltransferase
MYPTIETERLIIRKFEDNDKTALYEIMRKPEVMYAWEHGFSFDETQEWLARQKARYRQNGLGYMAVLHRAPRKSAFNKSGGTVRL